MTEFKDLTDRVNRLYLDLREAERQRDENLAKVLALQATVRELEARLDMISRPHCTELRDMPGLTTKCQLCGGDGVVGATPVAWALSKSVMIVCPLCKGESCPS